MTPTVESMIPGPRTVRISLSFVSKPPKKRMTVRAIIPTNCVLFVSLYWIPRPALPKSIPVMRKRSRAGTPKRVPTLPAMIPASIRKDPTRRYGSKATGACSIGVYNRMRAGVSRAVGHRPKQRYGNLGSLRPCSLHRSRCTSALARALVAEKSPDLRSSTAVLSCRK